MFPSALQITHLSHDVSEHENGLCRYCPGLKNEVCTNVKNTEISDCTEQDHTYIVTELSTQKKLVDNGHNP